jgi:hypothetical protein
MAKKSKASSKQVQTVAPAKVYNFNTPSMFGAKVNPEAVFDNPIILPCTKIAKQYKKVRSVV